MAGGRPSKYDPALGHRLAEHLRFGATMAEAARSEGVGTSSIDRWLARHSEFRDEVERAKGDPITQNLRRINIAATRGSWQAAAWLLERLAPERFGKVATELPALISALLKQLPPDVAGQVTLAWGILPPQQTSADTTTESNDDGEHAAAELS